MRILIAGGQCGTTMLRLAGSIEESALDKDIDVSVDIHDLWISSIDGTGYDLVVEMFPYFDELSCPVFSGKPFISRIGEKELIKQITDALELIRC